MSSSKSKKKSSKSAQLPVPIKIKKEDDHLMHPMEHYVDDRVELIRQIFSSLKPKTITNLAPEFLKKNKLEDIQEQCLNEILGISKKRLLSIINSTKCPTDTETSSDDDGVDAVAEHISLEEISSDSEVDDSKVASKKKKKVKKEAIENDGKKKKKVKKEETEDENKQFSVLELLELQARARAIRSQLALEPVTKIEVGTDSDEDGPPKQKPPPPHSSATSKKSNSKTPNGSSTSSKSETVKKPEPSTLTVILPNGDPTSTRRIKLKRNFRKKTNDEDSTEDHKSAETDKTGNKTPENSVPKTEARSPSPDVIPVITVPETLCISDSDEEKQQKDESTTNEAPVKSAPRLEILSVVNIEPPSKESDNNFEIAVESLSVKNSPRKTKPSESEEEGEIVEEEQPKMSNINETKSVENSPKPDKNVVPSSDKDEVKDTEMAPSTEGEKIDEVENVPEKSNQKPTKMEVSESDDDDNDDVISLEGGDLVDEMKEHMEDDVEEVVQKEDVICLDDSSEDEALAKKKAESWNDRWLNSRKVSRVLATSRLGNKVRNKIKESKKAKKLEEAAAMEKDQQEKPQQVVFVSKHELGSVEQYKEILELPKK